MSGDGNREGGGLASLFWNGHVGESIGYLPLRSL